MDVYVKYMCISHAVYNFIWLVHVYYSTGNRESWDIVANAVIKAQNRFKKYKHYKQLIKIATRFVRFNYFGLPMIIFGFAPQEVYRTQSNRRRLEHQSSFLPKWPLW